MDDIQTETATTKRAKRTPAFKPPAPYLTQKELPAYLKEKRGVPVSPSALEKLSAQGRLKPDKYYGQTKLYTPQTADKLANDLLTNRRVNLRLNKPSADSDPPEAA